MKLQGDLTTATMKAIVHDGTACRTCSSSARSNMPAIEDHQVLLRVHAASVNPVEWYGVTGPYFTRLSAAVCASRRARASAPMSPAGRSGRQGRHGFQPGDEVFGGAAALAEYAAAREERLAPKPANVSFEEAAAVPVAAMTALQALRDKGAFSPAEGADQRRVRGRRHVRGADREGVRRGVTAVCSTRNVDLARSLGADHVVDYTQEDFTRRGERTT